MKKDKQIKTVDIELLGIEIWLDCLVRMDLIEPNYICKLSKDGESAIVKIQHKVPVKSIKIDFKFEV
jgi:hypothetical protein